MLRRTLVLSWIAAANLVLPPSLIQAQTDNSGVPVSIERIRAALKQQPPVLQIPAQPDDMPTFRVEVRAPLSVLDPVDEDPFDPTFGLPSVGELFGRGVDKIRSAAVGYKRRRAERRARKEVDEALAAFCVVHECPTRPADR